MLGIRKVAGRKNVKKNFGKSVSWYVASTHLLASPYESMDAVINRLIVEKNQNQFVKGGCST